MLGTLHVSFVGQDMHGQDDTNCRCGKCCRTTLTPDALGQLRECPTFDHRVKMASNMDAVHPNNRLLLLDARALADGRGRQDIVRRIDASLAKSREAARLDTFRNFPLLWRLPHSWRKHAFGGVAHQHRLPAGAFSAEQTPVRLP